MIASDHEQLIGGANYLQGHNPLYIPEDKSSYDSYTFHFIIDALKAYSLESRISELIKTIIFDSLIGNSDRHQENWGFILLNEYQDRNAIKITNKILSARWFKSVLRYFFFIRFIKNALSKKLTLKEIDNFLDKYKGVYSPIYDSGCCLGRELEDDKVNKMLSDDTMLNAYINRGTSEIRWNGPKVNHFELIKNIKEEYPSVVKVTISNIMSTVDEQKIRQIVLDIDKNLPENLNQYKLPFNRKELIIKLITLRIQRLKLIQ